MQILMFLQTAFSIWMLVDAIKRGSPYYWYIIVMVPFGEWVYFFMVKIHDPEFQAIRNWFTHRPPSLKRLRYEAKTSPSVLNRTRLAQGLHDHKEYSEAAEVLREILKRNSDYKEALYCLGMCHGHLNEIDSAIMVLEKLIGLDMGYAGYSAAVELAGHYRKQGKEEERLELLQTVTKKSPSMSHIVELANCLIQANRSNEAKDKLQQALEDYDNAPAYVRRKNRVDAKAARTLVRSNDMN